MTKEEFVNQFKGEFHFSYNNMRIKVKRGSKEECEEYTGILNEIVWCEENKTLYLHDGETKGGLMRWKL